MRSPSLGSGACSTTSAWTAATSITDFSANRWVVSGRGSTACPVQNPTIQTNEALINSNTDCQRTALLSFFNTRISQNEGLPVKHPVRTAATLLKLDLAASNKNNISASWNFNHSRKENE